MTIRLTNVINARDALRALGLDSFPHVREVYDALGDWMDADALDYSATAIDDPADLNPELGHYHSPGYSDVRHENGGHR